jgi:diguanylate cyclase (GGDEF)-like protein
MLKRAVEKFGHECIVAENGRVAWEYFAHSEIDVVISDWMMPEMDGMELCRRVRDYPKTTYTYFVFLTAMSDKEHMLMGMEAGADDYLIKPLDMVDLKVQFLAADRLTSLHRRLTQQNIELERLNNHLFEQARRDPLTQLGNHLQLREDLEVMRGRVERYSHSYCAALCDIDSFKGYNDHYGHLAGNEVLREVALTISRHCRSGDEAYRFGGEEFLVILPEQSLESATNGVERMRRAVEELRIPHHGPGGSGIVTVSAGVSALLPGELKSVDALLKEADDALYKAKQSGKNRVRVHESYDTDFKPKVTPPA